MGQSGHIPWLGRDVRLDLRKPTSGAMILMGLCTLVVVLLLASRNLEGRIYGWFSLYSGRRAVELWRFITFQFLHAGAQHFLFNMAGLYFFGPPLERVWGRGRFVAFYLLCGVAGGVSFELISLGGHGGTLVGASGGVLGCLMGCAIVFPDMKVIIVPIRWAAGILVCLYVMSVFQHGNGGDAAHLGGMIAAAAWVFAANRRRMPRRQAQPDDPHAGRWQRKLQEREKVRQEIDRILQKIHDHGLASLTGREKRILKKATDEQRAEEQRISRL